MSNIEKRAFELGQKAYNDNNGVNCFAHCNKGMALINGSKVGDSSTIGIMESWNKGFEDAKDTYMRKTFPDLYEA